MNENIRTRENPDLSYLDPIERAAIAFRITHLSTDPDQCLEQIHAILQYIRSVQPKVKKL